MCLSSQCKVNKVHKHSEVFGGQLLLNIKRKLLYEVRLVKCKLLFIIIGHSGSNHSAFYLNAANSAGFSSNPCYVQGCGLCTIMSVPPITSAIMLITHFVR